MGMDKQRILNTSIAAAAVVNCISLLMVIVVVWLLGALLPVSYGGFVEKLAFAVAAGAMAFGLRRLVRKVLVPRMFEPGPVDPELLEEFREHRPVVMFTWWAGVILGVPARTDPRGRCLCAGGGPDRSEPREDPGRILPPEDRGLEHQGSLRHGRSPGLGDGAPWRKQFHPGAAGVSPGRSVGKYLFAESRWINNKAVISLRKTIFFVIFILLGNSDICPHFSS
jgi:hypothetical protein